MITQKSVEELTDFLMKVETALAAALRPTKSLIVETMSNLGQCSRGSTGFEKSFLKALKAKNVPLTLKFAALMGERATASATALAAPTAATPAAAERDPNQLSRINLKGVSLISIRNGLGIITFIGGGTRQLGKFDESSFLSKSNHIEFNVS